MNKTMLLLAILSLTVGVCAAEKDKEKDKKASSSTQLVDSGSFGIFVNGARIGTEKFRVEQGPEVGIINSEIKVESGDIKADQSSEMQVSRNGDLRSYKWRSNVPVKEESIVEPKDELLVEHVTAADQKKQDVPYILPLATVILDDNFFVHREVLVWRYLSGCLQTKNVNELACDKASHFGILVPHQHMAGNVVVELAGREKITIKGVQVELNKVHLHADGVEWTLWVDDPDNHYRVIKITIAGSNVEVLRD